MVDNQTIWTRAFNCFFVFAFYLLQPSSIYAAQSSNAQEIVVTRTVLELFEKLESNENQVVALAALKLGNYAYSSVNQKLLAILTKESIKSAPNEEILVSALTSLEKTGTSKIVRPLKDIRNRLKNSIARNTIDARYKSILNYIDRAIHQSGQRSPTFAPPLQLASTIASDLTTPLQSKFENNDNLSHETNPQQKPLSVREELSIAKKVLLKTIIANAKGSEPSNHELKDAIKYFIQGTSSYLSDEIILQLKRNNHFQIIGRDREVDQVIDILSREKGGNPILVGPRGAGKTSIAQKVAYHLLQGKLPTHNVYHDRLADAYVVETSPARISRIARSNDQNAQADALESYFDSILNLESALGIKIIVFIDEIHVLGNAQIEAMKPYLDSRTRGIKLIGASTGREFQQAFKFNPALQRRFELVGVSEQSFAEVKNIILESEVPRAEKRFGIEIPESVVDVLIENANRLFPDTSLVDASSKLIMSLCTQKVRDLDTLNSSSSVEPTENPLRLTENDVYHFIKNRLGYPVNPLDAAGLKQYKNHLLALLNNEILGQERMVGDIVDEWIRVLKPNSKGVRSILLLGPTGVGKTQLGIELAKAVFGSPSAFLRVDGNMFKTEGFSDNTFFGAPNGVKSSSQTSGMLYDYLDDPGRGKYGGIIMIDEAERAHPQFWESMMEIMDTGRGIGRDGRERKLARHLIILTSNQGDSTLFPKTIDSWTLNEYKSHMATLTEERLKQAFRESPPGKDDFRLEDPVLARIDKYSAAEPITPSKVELIALQKARRLIQQSESLYKIKIDLDKTVPEKIAQLTYEKGLGVRPVEKRVLNDIEGALDLFLANHSVHRGDLIHMSLVEEQKNVLIVTSSGENQSTYTVPVTAKIDPLADEDFLSRIQALDHELKSRIYGQDEMIERVKDAVISHQAAETKRPLSLFLVGSTGSGKTETAKALAQSLYRREDRVVVFDLGKITRDSEFNDIFGASTGFEGGSKESRFETFLRENPQGGVIVFDEISNMGGTDRAQKTALFKKLYSIFEEGQWHSNASDKTYLLGKYTIVCTGNDLEELLHGVSADQLRMSIWKKNKSPSVVHKMLVKSGVPEAFLGRMADFFLMKPLLSTEIPQITKKILYEVLPEFENKGLQFDVSETFIQDVSRTFYTSNQGARSIRNLIEFRIRSAITKLVIQSGGIDRMRNQTIQLSMSDNLPRRHYLKSSDPEREVFIYATLKTQDAEVPLDRSSLAKAPVIQIDVTEFASKIHPQSFQNLLQTAYHEAGHAVANRPDLTMEELIFISVTGRDEYLGFAQYEPVKNQSHLSTEETMIAKIAALFGGTVAEEMAGFSPNAGQANDIKKARILATTYILEWGLGKDLASVQIDDEGRPKLNSNQLQKFQTEMNRIFDEARKIAKTTLLQNWNRVRSTAAFLIKNAEITGEEFNELARQSQAQNRSIQWIVDDKISPKAIRIHLNSEQNKVQRGQCQALFGVTSL